MNWTKITSKSYNKVQSGNYQDNLYVLANATPPMGSNLQYYHLL